MRRILDEAKYRFKNDGTINQGGTVTFKLAGTSTDKAAYDDYALTTALSNPLTLDSNGRSNSGSGEVWFESGNYDITIKDSDGNTINSISDLTDDFSASTSGGSDLYNINGSFESVTDGVPDDWTLSVYGGSGGTIALDETCGGDGLYSLKFTSIGAGAGTATGLYFPVPSDLREYNLSWTMISSVVDIRNEVDILWYDKDKSALTGADASTNLYSNDSTNSTTLELQSRNFTPPSDARWGQVRLTGAHSSDATSGYVCYDNVVLKSILSSSVATANPKGMLLTLDTDTDHDVNISAGSVRSYTDTYSIIHSTEMTKQIDAAWASGDDAGGLDTGTVAADSMYAVWAIANTSTSAVDYLISLSFTAPTMPSGYDESNLIGVLWTDSSSNLIAFEHYGNQFTVMGVTPLIDINDSTIVDHVFETGVLRCPPNCIAGVFVTAANETTTNNVMDIYVKTKGSSFTASIATAFLATDIGTSMNWDRISSHGNVHVDSSSQVEYAMVELDGSSTVQIAVTGCFMLTRGNPNI